MDDDNSQDYDPGEIIWVGLNFLQRNHPECTTEFGLECMVESVFKISHDPGLYVERNHPHYDEVVRRWPETCEMAVLALETERAKNRGEVH